MIRIIKILCMAILEGFTALIPVSSMAHFSLLGEVFNFTDDNFNFMFYYSVFALGSTLALYIYYFKVHNNTFTAFFKSKKKHSDEKTLAYKKASHNVLLSVLPLLLLFIPIGNDHFVGSFVSYFMSSSLLFIGIASLFCAVLMLIAHWYMKQKYAEKKSLLTKRDSLFFGFYQLAAYVFPGLSHVSLGASRVALSDIGTRNILKETYLYIAPAMLVVNTARAVWYGIGADIDIIVTLAGFLLSFVVSIIVLHIVNKSFSKRAFRVFVIYNLIFALLLLGTSLYRMFA